MSIKQKLTGVAVDSLRDYLQEKLDNIKQLDLDGDGHKDVDQIAELLTHLSATVKDSIDSTDFPKLATGIEQIMSGLDLIGSSANREKWAVTCTELGATLKQLGRLLQLGVHQMEQNDNKTH